MAVKSNLTTMAVCLTVVSLVCSALLGGMYALTAEPIAKANADILKASIGAVLPEGANSPRPSRSRSADRLLNIMSALWTASLWPMP